MIKSNYPISLPKWAGVIATKNLTNANRFNESYLRMDPFDWTNWPALGGSGQKLSDASTRYRPHYDILRIGYPQCMPRTLMILGFDFTTTAISNALINVLTVAGMSDYIKNKGISQGTQLAPILTGTGVDVPHHANGWAGWPFPPTDLTEIRLTSSRLSNDWVVARNIDGTKFVGGEVLMLIAIRGVNILGGAISEGGVYYRIRPITPAPASPPFRTFVASPEWYTFEATQFKTTFDNFIKLKIIYWFFNTLSTDIQDFDNQYFTVATNIVSSLGPKAELRRVFQDTQASQITIINGFPTIIKAFFGN